MLVKISEKILFDRLPFYTKTKFKDLPKDENGYTNVTRLIVELLEKCKKDYTDNNKKINKLENLLKKSTESQACFMKNLKIIIDISLSNCYYCRYENFYKCSRIN